MSFELPPIEDKNYVAGWHDYVAGKIVMLERNSKGELFKKSFNPPYYFYVPSEDGDYETIFGDRVLRAEFDSKEEFEAAKLHFRERYESDFSPLSRVMMDHYYGRPAPKVNIAFIDIENDYSSKIGWPSPTYPYASINAVTIYQSWTKTFLVLVIPPKNWKGSTETIMKKYDELVKDGQLRDGFKPELTICGDEHELLALLLKALNDADIISGWNSEMYDIPYICERLLLIGGERMVRRLDYLGAPKPRKEVINHYGSEEPIWKFSGKSFLDYMRLFKKFNLEGRSSYALGNILEEEVGIGKLEYEGTLEELYNDDFETFVCYNFRDVDGLVQLDDKFGYMALANQMVHENTVNFGAVLGTVNYVETGMTNFAHYNLNKVVNDKRVLDTNAVEGALVLTPPSGMHEWISAVDIKSLYPNTIWSLNASPETIIGQFPAKGDAWLAIRQKTEDRLTFILESGEQHILTGKEWNQVLRDKKWAVSGYGTVFDQTKIGLVAATIGFWYEERKKFQAEKKKYGKLVRSEQDENKKAEYQRLYEHFDMLQGTKKVGINSSYGALLSAYFRFGDERLGASTTGSGRQITTHMLETLSEILTGIRTPIVKSTIMDNKGKIQHHYTSASEAILYSDTDSVAPDSIIQLSEWGDMTVESAFAQSPIKWSNGDKEYASGLKGKILGFDKSNAKMLDARCIYRHKTNKRRFKITLSNGKQVIVTEDHSIMVLRDKKLMSLKPTSINTDTDTCITIKR